MKRYVQISELKSHLSEYLRSVRGGHPLIVMDRKTPIAQVLPYQEGPATIVIRPSDISTSGDRHGRPA